jgi:hypothetical protein
MFVKDLMLLTFALLTVIFFAEVFKYKKQQVVTGSVYEISDETVSDWEYPHPIFPENGGIYGHDLSELRWGGGLSDSRVEISKRESFSEVVFGGAGKGFSFSLPGDMASGVYYWRVGSNVLDNEEGNLLDWSNMGCFVIGPLEGGIIAPQQQYPVFERIDISDISSINPIEFSWFPVSYDGGSCPAFAKKYRIEIASDPYFIHILYSADSLEEYIKVQDTGVFSKTFVKMAKSTSYYWRVKAFDAWDKEGSWSLVSSFTLAKNSSLK